MIINKTCIISFTKIDFDIFDITIIFNITIIFDITYIFNLNWINFMDSTNSLRVAFNRARSTSRLRIRFNLFSKLVYQVLKCISECIRRICNSEEYNPIREHLTKSRNKFDRSIDSGSLVI